MSTHTPPPSGTASRPRPGHCSWHKGWANDVILVTVIEAGSGPGGGAYACLTCARPMTTWRNASEWLKREVAAMEKRAAQRNPTP